ncbi:MAG: AAA family ATPase [Deltaproteobacteria bacterium]|nr:AAA family ATPase [Deltaproteobacteria bacterium]
MKEKQGMLARVGLPGLLHLIYLRKDESAVLDIIKEPIKKRFYFRQGIPVAASSNILNEVLGRLLMQEGVITQQQYETSLETVLKEKKRHGEVLISMGLLTPEALEDFLALQLKRRLFRLFDWDEGSYRYIKTDLPGNIPSRPFHPASLILEGISLGFYPAAKIRAGLDGLLGRKIALTFEGSAYRIDDFRLNLQEKRFAETIDGSRTLAEALDSSDLLRHRAESIALSLALTGLLTDEQGAVYTPEVLLEVGKETQAPEVPVDSKLNAELLFMRARSAISRRDFSAAIAILKDITNINPAEGEYWAWLGWAIYNEDPSKLKEVESIIKDSIDLNNDLDAAWYFLGTLFLAEGNIVWAKIAFETALTKNPWNTEALSELKRLELRLIYRDAPQELTVAFGFTEDPFAPVPRTVSLSEVQTAVLESLLRAIRKKTGPVLLEGGGGTGKTTVILELLKKLSSDKVLSALVLKPAGREMDLIKEINRGLGCPAEASTVKEQLLNLGMRVSQNRIQGGSTLVIIDEAHRLSNGCLKLIQYLSRLKAVQLLLSGEPSLAEKLKTPEFQELGEKLSSRITLSDLSKEETAALIDSMLSKAGRRRKPGQPSFAIGIEEAQEIFEAAKGNPGAIRREAAAHMQKAFDDLMAEAAAPQEQTSVEEKFEEKNAEAPAEEVFVSSYEQQAREEAGPEAPVHEELPELENVPEQAVSDKWEDENKPAASAPSHVSNGEHINTPAHAAGEPTISYREEPPVKKSMLRLVFWVILMIVAGLVAGSLIGTYWFGQPRVSEEAISPPVQPAEPAPLQPGETDKGAPLDGSLDMGSPEGSI